MLLCVCVCVCVCVCMHAHTQFYLFGSSWMVAHQVPLPKEFPRQEYWSGLSFSTPRDLPDLGIKSKSLVSPTLSGRFFTTVPPGKPLALNLIFMEVNWKSDPRAHNHNPCTISETYF